MAAGRHVAFLRGINVGRARRVAMADLRALLEGLGHTEVRTHLQSGNAVFTAAPGSGRPDTLARAIERAIESELGMTIDVEVRSRKQLASVIAEDPLGDVATDPAKYLVLFVNATPAAAKVSAVDVDAYLPERFAVRGREIYQWAPNGVNDARLTKAIASFGLVATGRNWNTVTRLLELLDE